MRDVLKSRRLPRGFPEASPTFSSSADNRRNLPCGLLASSSARPGRPLSATSEGSHGAVMSAKEAMAWPWDVGGPGAGGVVHDRLIDCMFSGI